MKKGHVSYFLVESSRYSLRQMVDMTGISEFTLRGWEMRYGAFKPSRTATGRRIYSSQELQKAILLRELLKRGHKISRVAELKPQQLNQLMEEGVSKLEPSAGFFAFEVEEVMRFVALQDWTRLDEAFSKAFKKRKSLPVIREFVLPVFQQMSSEVTSGRMSIAQEHILSSVLKQNLYRLLNSGIQSSDCKFVVAAPEGDFHELGILVSHVLLNQYKVGSLFLGSNTPKDQLCETANLFGATHILLGSTITQKEGAKEDFYKYVHFLDKNLPKHVSFWFGGRASMPVSLKRQTLLLTSLEGFELKLKNIRTQNAKPEC